MLATIGHVLLWTLAVLGFIAACGIVGAILDDRKKARIDAAQPQPQMEARLASVPEPKPELLYRVVILRKDAVKR